AQELHDVLAHNISLISVQAGVGLHLIDEHPDQARAALAAIKEASREALGELRSVLDVLRRDGDAAPLVPAPRLAADLDGLVARARPPAPALAPVRAPASAPVRAPAPAGAAGASPACGSGPPPSAGGSTPGPALAAASGCGPGCRFSRGQPRPRAAESGDPGPPGRRPGAGAGRVPGAPRRRGRPHRRRGAGQR